MLDVRELSADQNRLIEFMEKRHRVAAAAANAVGKTFLEGAYGVYWMDAVGSRLDAETGEPEGALWLLTAPVGDQIFELVWGEALKHIRRAARKGFQMGGFYSERSVTWRIREDWRIEGIAPPRRAGEEQQHGASGRHHKNLLYTLDEAAGIEAARYRAAEGIASGLTNKIILMFNPTEITSAAKDAWDDAGYDNIRISALDHPNVVARREVIPGAISHARTEARILNWCEDRGVLKPGIVEPDPAFNDFLWSMHPWARLEERRADVPDPMPRDETLTLHGREYRVLGHADGEIRVYRPDDRFSPTVLGLFPADKDSQLFPEAHLQKAQELWADIQRSGGVAGAPTRVGLDPAEEGGDEPSAAPTWHLANGIHYTHYLRPLKPARPKELAAEAYGIFGRAPTYVVDAIGIGSGVENELDSEYGVQTIRFKSSHSGKVSRREGEPEFGNRRAAAYWRASVLLKDARVALPPDPVLRKQLGAITRFFRQGKLFIVDKAELKKQLGMSTDRADAWVMSLWEDAAKRVAGAVQTPTGPRRGRVVDPYEFYANRGS